MSDKTDLLTAAAQSALPSQDWVASVRDNGNGIFAVTVSRDSNTCYIFDDDNLRETVIDFVRQHTKEAHPPCSPIPAAIRNVHFGQLSVHGETV